MRKRQGSCRLSSKTGLVQTSAWQGRGRANSSPPADEQTPLLSLDHQLQTQSSSGHGESHDRDHGIDAMREWFSRKLQPSRSKSPKHENKRNSVSEIIKRRPGALPRPVGGTDKLGTFAGVFVPTTLNVLSILMFLRFGFILGQSGVLGMMGTYIYLNIESK